MTQQRSITLTPIGIIHTPHRVAAGTPIQPAFAKQCEGRVIVDRAFEAALADLDDFERVWLVYWFDRASRYQPRVVPYRDNRQHGLFATRSPCRPSPVGLSVVRLLGRVGNVLTVGDVDILDGTPLLDLKPYVPAFDAHPSSAAGWIDEGREERQLADERFHRKNEP